MEISLRGELEHRVGKVSRAYRLRKVAQDDTSLGGRMG
jgi:hypothetical protein